MVIISFKLLCVTLEALTHRELTRLEFCLSQTPKSGPPAAWNGNTDFDHRADKRRSVCLAARWRKTKTRVSNRPRHEKKALRGILKKYIIKQWQRIRWFEEFLPSCRGQIIYGNSSFFTVSQSCLFSNFPVIISTGQLFTMFAEIQIYILLF